MSHNSDEGKKVGSYTMKKNLCLLGLVLLILIPLKVKAAKNAKVQMYAAACSDMEPNTTLDPMQAQKSCPVTIKNISESVFKARTQAIVVEGASAVIDIKLDSTSTNGIEIENPATGPVTSPSSDPAFPQVWTATIKINDLAPGEEATFNIINTYNNSTGESCDIRINFKGKDQGDRGGTELVQTGYAIPFVALGLGIIVLVIVLANFKKKNKMYRI